MDTAPAWFSAQRGWGLAGFIVSILAVLPIAFTLALMGLVDPNFGWFMLLAFPWAIIVGAVGAVLAVVGLIVAIRRRTQYAWPVAGLVIGVAITITTFAIVS